MFSMSSGIRTTVDQRGGPTGPPTGRRSSEQHRAGLAGQNTGPKSTTPTSSDVSGTAALLAITAEICWRAGNSSACVPGAAYLSHNGFHAAGENQGSSSAAAMWYVVVMRSRRPSCSRWRTGVGCFWFTGDGHFPQLRSMGTQDVGWNRLRRFRAGVGGDLGAVTGVSWRHNCFGGGCRGKADRRCCARRGQRRHQASADALPGAHHSSLATDPAAVSRCATKVAA
jgi:hypothetical protein